MLAYLLLAERPPGRRQLAELLFGDADDPLGALRWTLAELRRALGAPALFGGDPVATGLGPGLEVDVRALTEESDELDNLPLLLALGGELLEGLSVAASPAFESWLVVERHRVAGVVEARLRQVAMRLLAAGRAEEAVAYASRAVARNPARGGQPRAAGAEPGRRRGPGGGAEGRWRWARTPCGGSWAWSRRRPCGTRRPRRSGRPRDRR